VMRELGVIPVLKELQDEPSGRGRNSFTFALSRLDEEGNGIAALELQRKKEMEARDKESATKAQAREARRKEIMERIKARPEQLAKRIAKPAAKNRTRK